MFIVPNGVLGGGKHVHCAKWRVGWRETCSLCQMARWVAGNMFIVPNGALGGGKHVHRAKWHIRWREKCLRCQVAD
jgi:hypothetical protein